jgi:hypothetical protein
MAAMQRLKEYQAQQTLNFLNDTIYVVEKKGMEGELWT